MVLLIRPMLNQVQHIRHAAVPARFAGLHTFRQATDNSMPVTCVSSSTSSHGIPSEPGPEDVPVSDSDGPPEPLISSESGISSEEFQAPCHTGLIFEGVDDEVQSSIDPEDALDLSTCDTVSECEPTEFVDNITGGFQPLTAQPRQVLLMRRLYLARHVLKWVPHTTTPFSLKKSAFCGSQNAWIDCAPPGLFRRQTSPEPPPFLRQMRAAGNVDGKGSKAAVLTAPRGRGRSSPHYTANPRLVPMHRDRSANAPKHRLRFSDPKDPGVMPGDEERERDYSAAKPLNQRQRKEAGLCAGSYKESGQDDFVRFFKCDPVTGYNAWPHGFHWPFPIFQLAVPESAGQGFLGGSTSGSSHDTRYLRRRGAGLTTNTNIRLQFGSRQRPPDAACAGRVHTWVSAGHDLMAWEWLSGQHENGFRPASG